MPAWLGRQMISMAQRERCMTVLILIANEGSFVLLTLDGSAWAACSQPPTRRARIISRGKGL